MSKMLKLLTFSLFLFPVLTFAQVPAATHIAILKAEDARNYDKVIDDLLIQGTESVRVRAALAAGRIGDVAAIPQLIVLLETGSPQEREMAAFALGEIESVKAANTILKALTDASANTQAKGSFAILKARYVEAAGKIAAANPYDYKAKTLGKAIIAALENEYKKGHDFDRGTVILGLTALMRVQPDGADVTAAKFLAVADLRVRSDAASTLARLHAKNATAELRKIALDPSDMARINAIRALASAEDKDSFELFVDALTDKHAQVRVAAIHALGSLKDARAATPLLDSAEKLLVAYKASKLKIPNEQNELLEIVAVLGRLLTGTRNERAVGLLRELGKIDNGISPEIYIAKVRIAPDRSKNTDKQIEYWRQYSTLAQIMTEFADTQPDTDEAKTLKDKAPQMLKMMIDAYLQDDTNKIADPKHNVYAAPDFLQAYARFKTSDLNAVLRSCLKHSDLFVRAAAAGLIAAQPTSKENVDALKTAFTQAFITDKLYNDAQLAILDALYKLDKNASVGTLLVALNASDYLVRTKAFKLLDDENLRRDFPGIKTSVELARAKNKDKVLPYAPALGTKLGQLLNTAADYRRAIARKNGTVKAVFTTAKGSFTIEFLPEDAPLTVDNFIKLVNTKYFNGLEVHRVVPNFVMQDGDSRGDGNGGPGWSIRCEVNMVPYNRGSVGMALSGKDTGGSQWFVTHNAQPHLDGGYTVFGQINETGMKVVDNIARGDKIISVRLVGN